MQGLGSFTRDGEDSPALAPCVGDPAPLYADFMPEEPAARLNGALLRAGLIGGSETPALFDGPDLTTKQWPNPLRLDAATVRAGRRLWLQYTMGVPHNGTS